MQRSDHIPLIINVVQIMSLKMNRNGNNNDGFRKIQPKNFLFKFQVTMLDAVSIFFHLK